MATHYLIDGHTNPLLNSEINDVRTADDGSSVVNGNFVIRVPFGVKLGSDPTDVSDLITKKFTGLLASYPGFSNIVYDELVDAADIAVTSSAPVQYRLGDRGTVGYNNGFLTPTDAGLETTAVSTAPTSVSQCIVVAEFHRYVYTNPKTGRMERIYEEADAPDAYIAVSSNGGTDYTAASNGQLVTIPAPQVGNSLRVLFSGFYNPRSAFNPADVLQVSSWAVIY